MNKDIFNNLYKQRKSSVAKVKRPHLLVIGGTGFIGRNLLLAAKKKGWKLTSVSLNYPKKDSYINGVKYVLADVANLLELKKLFNDLEPLPIFS